MSLSEEIPSERKRSLPSDDEEDHISGDDSRGRFKRPALNNDSTDNDITDNNIINPIKNEEDNNSTEFAFQEEVNGEERAASPALESPAATAAEVLEVNVRSPVATEKEKNAFALVARKVLDENLDAPSTANSKSTTIRLLVAHSKMGPVIGKGGCKIKEIQEKSGARCLASEDMLPQSTERTISITGVPDSIHIAVFHVGEELAKHQNDRNVNITLYRPQPRIIYHQAAAAAPSLTAGNPFYVGLPPAPPPYGRDFLPGPPPGPLSAAHHHQPPPVCKYL
ncbi:13412_t:CDS:2 [Entrophospora sp. SA101]|nr:13412_t:CDS:2 [Entrophospora sp. SA101]